MCMELDKIVSVAACQSYHFPVVRQSLGELLEPFDGLAGFFDEGSRVLIKPNLLASAPPEKAVTTHPAVIKALILVAQERGARVFVGDSPMGGSLEKVAAAAGIAAVAEETGATLLPFQQVKTVSYPQGRVCKEFPLAAEALEMDFIINAGKLKTHALTGLTLSIKNCYGFLASVDKLRYHARYPSIHDFADFLLDLYLAVKPGFNIIDAVVGMEGPGPRKGRPKPLGALLASPNGIALDAVCGELAGFAPHEITTLQAAARRKLPGHDIRQLEIRGPLQELRNTTFDKGTASGNWSFLWRYAPTWARHFQQRRRPWPRIGDECNLCESCLQHCPVGIMEIKKEQGEGGKKSVDIDYGKCLRCYCCQEICPRGAVKLK